MSYALWTLLSIAVYVLGIILFGWATPRLYWHSYDQLAFTGFAALEIVAALCTFGAVAITYGLFSGSFAIKVLDFLLLIGILVIGIRLAFRSFRARRAGVIIASRNIAGLYFLLLILAALFYMALLFGL